MHLKPEQLDRYCRTVSKAGQWIYDHLDALMTLQDIQAFYKAPYAWCASGDVKMAGVYRRLIAEKFLREDGDFRSEPDAKGFFHFPCTVHNQYLYSDGWLITGMQRLGVYEIVRKGLEFVLPFQNPAHGGFYNTFDAKTRVLPIELFYEA